METRVLGAYGLQTAAIGLGCMGMTGSYGHVDEVESIRTIHRALELGVTLLDTADIYGVGLNEELVGRALAGGRRQQALVATKFGHLHDPATGKIIGVSGRPEYVRSACEASLRRLAIDHIDLYQQHRVDRHVPIEETVGAMKELLDEGKVRYLGLSEAQPEDIRRAARVAPISTLQTEYSLFERHAEGAILDTCEEFRIGFLAYSPLGRGMLTGRWQGVADFDEIDTRGAGTRYPRYQPGNFEHNLALAETVRTVGVQEGYSPAQVSLAWLLARRPWIVPIPGTTRVERIEENAAATGIVLTAEELAVLDALGEPAGTRYPEASIPAWTSPPLVGA